LRSVLESASGGRVDRRDAPVAEVLQTGEARSKDGLEGIAGLVLERKVKIEIVLDLLWSFSPSHKKPVLVRVDKHAPILL
jgi:hypothetical protein